GSRPGRFTRACSGGGADTLECGTTEEAGGIFRARRRGKYAVAQELLRTRQKLLPLKSTADSADHADREKEKIWKPRNPEKKVELCCFLDSRFICKTRKLEAIDRGFLDILASSLFRHFLHASLLHRARKLER